MWDLIYRAAEYAYDKKKEVDDWDEKLAYAYAMFDPNNVSPVPVLPIFLNQWVQDPNSPSGWSYKAHEGMLEPPGWQLLANAYLMPTGIDGVGVAMGEREKKARELLNYQSYEFQAGHPWRCTTYDYGLGTVCVMDTPLLKDELIHMPPAACDVANAKGAEILASQPTKVFAPKSKSSQGGSKDEGVGVGTILVGTAVVAGGGYALWHYWPSIVKSFRKIF